MSEDSRIAINDEKERRNKRGIVVLVSLFVIACLCAVCCCFILSDLPRIYQFSLLNFTEEGKAAKALLEEAEIWEIEYYDGFLEDKELWWVGSDSSEFGIYSQTIEDGVYRIDATAKQGFYRKETYNIRPVRDFYLAVKGNITSGSCSGDYGVVFRKKGSDFYQITIDDSGYFDVRIMYEGEWEQLKVGNFISKIGVDIPRKITVIAKGSNFYFFVDDQFVTHVEDDRLSSGFVGLTFGLHYAGDQAIFEFDNFELRVPQE